MLLCVVLFYKEGIVVMGVLTSSTLFQYERSRGHLFVLGWARVRRVARGSVVSE